jgi:hypothetical protein
MKETIYLIGQISVDEPETYEWRRNVRRCFAGKPDWKIIDPCNNGFNKTVFENNGDGKDVNRLKVYRTKGIELIVPKDCSYVMRSTMAICNMNQYDRHKPIIGTCFELAWYYLNPEKTVIGIYDGNPEDDIHCKHPFVKSAVDVWVKDEYDAAELAFHYYQDAAKDIPSFEEYRIVKDRLDKCEIGKIDK